MEQRPSQRDKIQEALASAIPARREREALEAARAATRAEARRYHIEREPETVELQALFTQYISACKRSETKAVKLIERAGDSVYKELLTLHYLEGLSWEAVAFRMNYSAGHILRLHAAALENIKRGNG